MRACDLWEANFGILLHHNTIARVATSPVRPLIRKCFIGETVSFSLMNISWIQNYDLNPRSLGMLGKFFLSVALFFKLLVFLWILIIIFGCWLFIFLRHSHKENLIYVVARDQKWLDQSINSLCITMIVALYNVLYIKYTLVPVLGSLPPSPSFFLSRRVLLSVLKMSAFTYLHSGLWEWDILASTASILTLIVTILASGMLDFDCKKNKW